MAFCRKSTMKSTSKWMSFQSFYEKNGPRQAKKDAFENIQNAQIQILAQSIVRAFVLH